MTDILIDMGVDYRDRKPVRNLCVKQSAYVRIANVRVVRSLCNWQTSACDEAVIRETM